MALPIPYYQDESVTIYNADCRDILSQLPKVDLVLTDPPYGLTECVWDIELELDQWWQLIKPLCSTVILTASQPFTSKCVMSNVASFKHEWIWIKNRGSNFANTVREPMKEHETILVFADKPWTYNKQMQERTGAGLERVKYPVNSKTSSENYREFDEKMLDCGEMRVPSSWQKFNTEVGLHPTQKPVALFSYLIATYSNIGDLILDPFMGSGTTLVAAQSLGRKSIGIETEEKYCKIAVERLRQKSFNLESPIEPNQIEQSELAL